MASGPGAAPRAGGELVNAMEAGNAMFARALKALGPYLGELVVVGGWAHRLYGLHSMSRASGFQPLMTEDADIAAPTKMKKKGESIAELLKREGFEETSSVKTSLPSASTALAIEDGGLYVEFLVPLIGGDYRRDGSRNTTARVEGVTAQKLRYLDIVVTEPWTVRLSDKNGFPLGSVGLDVQIANARVISPRSCSCFASANLTSRRRICSTFTIPS